MSAKRFGIGSNGDTALWVGSKVLGDGEIVFDVHGDQKTVYASVTPEAAVEIADQLYKAAGYSTADQSHEIYELEKTVSNLKAQLEAEARFGHVQTQLANTLRDIIEHAVRETA